MQREIITSILEGKDTLGLLPTGGGKSLTFQVPALLLDGITLVITPLVSLMKDQVDNLAEAGIKAKYLHAGLSHRETKLITERCIAGKLKILYLSPEKLQSPAFVDILHLFPISLIVVDEAHCISQWGYDFRPSYLKIAELRKIHPDVPVLALTASATPEVVDDIMAQLRFRSRNVFSRSFSRDNISYIVRYHDYKEQALLRVLGATSGSAIVYVRSRRRTHEISDTLNGAGIKADFYHAGLSPEDKNEKQNRWKDGRVRVMVATTAFGMGIDKSDVRTVVHVDVPSSLEEYYQEAGRAGRDGLPAFAVLIASRADKGILSRRITETFPAKDYVKNVYEQACVFLGVAVGSGYGGVYEFDFTMFCNRYSLRPVPAHNALMLLTQAGYIEYVEEITTRSRLMVLLDKRELYDLKMSDTTDRVFQLILRTYTGLFADYAYISESLIASRLHIPEEEVYQSLLSLARMHAIHYVPRKTTPYIVFSTSREETRYIQLPDTIYKNRRQQMERRIDAMKRFAFTDEECRVNVMLKYFGENPECGCGKCDICRRNGSDVKERISKDSTIRDSILYLASHPGGATITHIASQTGVTPRRISDLARDLIDNGDLTLQLPETLIATKS